MTVKWSLCMIARNNEDVLPRTLDGVKDFIDEIIVVDTGSTDKTVEIAKSYGARVKHFEWCDDFAKARNYAFSLATGDWIMWLDTGDVLTPESQKTWVEIKNSPVLTDTKVEIISSPINRNFDSVGNVLSSGSSHPRLLRRSANPVWVGAVHEQVKTDNQFAVHHPDAYINDIDRDKQQHNERNLKIIERLLAEGDTSPRTKSLQGNELMALERYEEAVEAYQEYLEMDDNEEGIYNAIIGVACCFRALEQQDNAHRALIRGIYNDPTRAEAFFHIGELYYEAKEFQSAIPFYQAIVGMVPQVTGTFILHYCYGHLPWERLAFCHFALGNTNFAKDALERAIGLADKDNAERLSAIKSQLGVIA